MMALYIVDTVFSLTSAALILLAVFSGDNAKFSPFVMLLLVTDTWVLRVLAKLERESRS